MIRVPRDSYEWLEVVPARAHNTNNEKEEAWGGRIEEQRGPSHSTIHRPGGRYHLEIGRVRAPWLRGPYYPRLPRHERILRRALLAGAAILVVRIVWGLW